MHYANQHPTLDDPRSTSTWPAGPRIAAGLALAVLVAGAEAGTPQCPPRCEFPPGSEVVVDLEWRPALIEAAVGETVEIALYATPATEADSVVAGIQAIVTWDPAQLELLGLFENGPYAWLSSGFTPDAALDDLNAGLDDPPVGVPANDGDAFYEALADFPEPIGDGPVHLPAEGLLVTTFRFEVLAESAGSVVAIVPTRGEFSCTAVFRGEGDVAGCDIGGQFGLATVVTQDVPLAILGSDPPDGAIDAGQPTTLDGAGNFGWDAVTLQFNADATGVVAGDFEVTVGCGRAPTITGVAGKGTAAMLSFDGPIPAGAWTTIRHVPSDSAVRIGFLPADVSGDGTSSVLDILALIDHLNGVGMRPPWSTDVDRSGAANQLDILRVIDLLNGAEALDPWNLVTICE